VGGVSQPSAVTDDVVLARAFLNRIAEPASVPLWIAVRRDGPVEVARAIRAGRAGSLVSAAVAARAATADPYGDLEAAQRRGARLVVPESAEWPHFAFSALEAAGERRAKRWLSGDRKPSDSGEPIPPLALWISGTLDLASVGVRSLAMVGARASTEYGEEVARRFAAELADRDFTVVSGGAYGIDAAAHRAALAAGGETVLVSAGGLDQPYPPGNASLYEQVAEAGLCISESPPGCAPRRRRFLTRNRLIAALGTGTVVVEAAYRSGAINTANHCVELGRPLMAVPGPITSGASEGCHRIIARDWGPARLVASVNDILEMVGSARDVLTEPDPQRREKFGLAERLDALDPVARQLFDGFPARAWTDVDRLAGAGELTPLAVIRALPLLELAGLIEVSDRGYRIAPAWWRKEAREEARKEAGGEARKDAQNEARDEGLIGSRGEPSPSVPTTP
jgi:DNA processing protein